MAAVNEGKALELIAKAEKKSKSFWPGSAKYEDAHDMFTRGANMLKVARKCTWAFSLPPSLPTCPLRPHRMTREPKPWSKILFVGRHHPPRREHVMFHGTHIETYHLRRVLLLLGA